jgi:hypothetical protein
MTIVVGAPTTGLAALRDASQSEIAYPRLGASVTIVTSSSSASANLPTDANGKLYSAYLVTASANAWLNFNTAGDAAVAGAANTYLVNGNGLGIVIPTPIGAVPGATAQASAIQDAAAGKVCIIGIF